MAKRLSSYQECILKRLYNGESMTLWRYHLGIPAHFSFNGDIGNVRKKSVEYLEKAGYLEKVKKRVDREGVLLTEKGKAYVANITGDVNEGEKGKS